MKPGPGRIYILNTFKQTKGYFVSRGLNTSLYMLSCLQIYMCVCIHVYMYTYPYVHECFYVCTQKHSWSKFSSSDVAPPCYLCTLCRTMTGIFVRPFLPITGVGELPRVTWHRHQLSDSCPRFAPLSSKTERRLVLTTRAKKLARANARPSPSTPSSWGVTHCA